MPPTRSLASTTRGVVVRDIPDTGWVRVSCGYWNTEEHLQRLLDALA